MAMSERTLQKEIIRSLQKLGFLVAHVPNESAYVKQRIANSHAGILPGFPDLIVLGKAGFKALIEVKTRDGKLSSVQNNLHERLYEMEHVVHIIYGLEHAQEVINLLVVEQESRVVEQDYWNNQFPIPGK